MPFRSRWERGVPRDPTLFIALVPGVAAVVTQASGPSYTSFNGAQQETNELYLEGVAMTFPNQQGDTRDLSLGVSVEAVEQFQVETNGGKAMYQGQGMHNYVLKSGANQFHGAVYEYFRNTNLDARGFFSPFVPVDHQNEFGGNIGGPIKKDKIFFFANYSGYYYNTATAPLYLSIPTVAAADRRFQRTADGDLRPWRLRVRRRDLLQAAIRGQSDSGQPHLLGREIVSVLYGRPDQSESPEQLSVHAAEVLEQQEYDQ